MNRKELVSILSLEEKARFVNGATFFGMTAIDRLTIPRMQLLDGGTGINFEQLFGDFVSYASQCDNSTNGMAGSTELLHVIEYFYEPGKLTESEYKLYEWIQSQLRIRTQGRELAPGCYPPGILLGATWNPSVIRKVGEALGQEARLYGVHILLGTPNVNIHRDPLNGRLFEGYSEDPCLVSTLAPELVKGVQEYQVAANVKHYAANNQETNRVGINETISRRALEEIYLLGFEACITEGKAATIMTAYNCINGVPCTESEYLLQEKLRKEWGFEGMVVSDWGAVYHPIKALQAGNDLNMPGPAPWQPIVTAVQTGELAVDVLNQAVEHILQLIDRYASPSTIQLCVDVMEENGNSAAYEAAAEGIVMLKNDARMFPLQANCSVAIIGTGRYSLMECGTGSAGITTNRTTKLREELCKHYGSTNIQCYDAIEDIPETVTDILCIARVSGMEGNDRPNMEMMQEDCILLDSWMLREKKARLALVLNVCGPVDLSRYVDRIDAIFAIFLPGMEGAHALADIMAGVRSPSGKLPITFPMHYSDTPTALNFPGDGYQVNYGEGIYVGYRYYDKKGIEPLYPFGYGLSYTQFVIENIQILEPIDLGEVHGVPIVRDNVKASIQVCNIGNTAGSEVVQIYLSDPNSTMSKPFAELKWFEKVSLQSQERKTIRFELPLKKFASFDPDYGEWIAEEGYYDIYGGNSSRNFTCKQSVYLDNHSQYSYGSQSTIKTCYEQQEIRSLLYDYFAMYGFDWGIIESNYQYTPNRTIEEVMEPILEKAQEKPLEKPRQALEELYATIRPITRL